MLTESKGRDPQGPEEKRVIWRAQWESRGSEEGQWDHEGLCGPQGAGAGPCRGLGGVSRELKVSQVGSSGF